MDSVRGGVSLRELPSSGVTRKHYFFQCWEMRLVGDRLEQACGVGSGAERHRGDGRRGDDCDCQGAASDYLDCIAFVCTPPTLSTVPPPCVRVRS